MEIQHGPEALLQLGVGGLYEWTFGRSVWFPQRWPLSTFIGPQVVDHESTVIVRDNEVLDPPWQSILCRARILWSRWRRVSQRRAVADCGSVPTSWWMYSSSFSQPMVLEPTLRDEATLPITRKGLCPCRGRVGGG